jgi:iron-sulfur cluster insertion protein
MINITDNAFGRIREIMLEDSIPSGTALRVFVQGGGCSGMEYGFTFDEAENEDDFVVHNDSVKVLVDSMSMQYLVGGVIDFKDDINGSRFVIDNPNAQTTCGCGSSFSPGI